VCKDPCFVKHRIYDAVLRAARSSWESGWRLGISHARSADTERNRRPQGLLSEGQCTTEAPNLYGRRFCRSYLMVDLLQFLSDRMLFRHGVSQTKVLDQIVVRRFVRSMLFNPQSPFPYLHACVAVAFFKKQVWHRTVLPSFAKPPFSFSNAGTEVYVAQQLSVLTSLSNPSAASFHASLQVRYGWNMAARSLALVL